jgi:hypothetical protein
MRDPRLVVFLALLSALPCACSRGPRSSPKPDDQKATGSDRAWPKDAPPRGACEKDEDCAIVPVAPAGPDPCCDVTVTAMPVSVRFLQWMESWQKKSCAGVTCPPLQVPGALLADCGYKPRCNGGTCDNSCNTASP